MKFRRFLSGLLFGLGCALSFIGLMAVVLPAIPNSQLQLVLSGFETTSSQPVVESINQWIRLVLTQNWRVFYLGLFIAAIGAVLFLHFTPKAQQPKEESVPMVDVQIAQPEQLDKPNPYARATCFQPTDPQTPRTVFQPEPILERNVIEEAEPASVFSQEVQPYFSPRFNAESRVTETTPGSWSQSGSRILIRSIAEPSAEFQAESQSETPLPSTDPVPLSPDPAARPSAHMTSPRIRSTMGRHNH